MYYVGCHWGTEHDGYICSSSRMLKAYNVRPQDFKRRIVKKGIQRENLLSEKYYWLSMIKDEELNDRYYNTQNHHFSHWTNSENNPEIRAKCGEKNKGRKHNLTSEQRAERGRKISEAKQRKKEEKLALGLPVRQPEKTPRPSKGPRSEETKRKQSETMQQKIASGEWQPWSAGKFLGPRSDETKQKQSEALKGKTRTAEQKLRISEANRRSWLEGKFSNRRSNNMKDHIWVKRKEDGSRTRIKKDGFDDKLYVLGR